MNSSTIETIQLILAPVVMITSCALLLNNIGGRYLALTNRLRSLARERLDLVSQSATGTADNLLVQERLGQIEFQIPPLLRHHRNLHNSVQSLYISVTLFLASMFALACAATAQLLWMELVALMIFLAGVAMMFFCMVRLALDFRNSHDLAQEEVRRTCGYKR